MVGNAKGYKSVIVMPETQSDEKKEILRICGADLRLVPAVPFKNPKNYVRYSEQLASELREIHTNGVIWANQFENLANMEGNFHSTGPEIWEQTEGSVDGFICAVGTGGTLAGVGKFLKTKNPNIKVGLADRRLCIAQLLHSRRIKIRWEFNFRRHWARTNYRNC